MPQAIKKSKRTGPGSQPETIISETFGPVKWYDFSMKARHLLIALAFSAFCFAQTPGPIDCIDGFGVIQGFPFTAAANTAQYQNNALGCAAWRLAYFVDGFSAVNVIVETAPDNNGVPGSWSTFAAGADGVNPNTSTTFATTSFFGAPAWIRVRLASVSGSGTVTGVLYGCRMPGCGSGTPTGAATPSTVTIAAAPLSAPITLTSSGLTQLIALSASKVITVYHLSVAFNATTDFQLEYGTGSACAAGTTAFTGLYKNVTTYAIDVPFALPASQALCANLGTAVTGGGLVLYSQQ